jgi:hypothetical protein
VDGRTGAQTTLSPLEESEDLYYIPDDYYSDELRYDSDMFKKSWEVDF